jgi:hypothetical protein
MSWLFAIRNPLGKRPRNIEPGGDLCQGRTDGHRACQSGDDQIG